MRVRVCVFNCFHLSFAPFAYTRRAHDTPCTAARPNVIVVAHSGRHISATLAMTQTNRVHQYRTHSPVNANVPSLSLSARRRRIWRKQNKLVPNRFVLEWLRMVCHLLAATFTTFAQGNLHAVPDSIGLLVDSHTTYIQAPLRGGQRCPIIMCFGRLRIDDISGKAFCHVY